MCNLEERDLKSHQKYNPNNFCDSEAALAEELVQSAAIFNAILDKQKAKLDQRAGKYVELRMYLFTVENELHSVFSDTEIAFRVYFCLVVSNCTGERSFSKLRRIKNYLRNPTEQEKLSMLSLTSMEPEFLDDVDLETNTNDFASKKCGVIKLFVADFFQEAHNDRVTETRVSLMNLLLSILRNLTPSQLRIMR